MLGRSRVVSLMPIKQMNRALQFYTKKLGARLLYRGRGEMRNSWASIKLGDHEIWMIRPEKWETRKLSYTTVVVKRIEPIVKGLVKKGVRFQRAERMGPDSRVSGPITYEPFGASAFFKDTEGNLLMVWQNVPPM